MATIDVKDALGATVALEKPLAAGQATMVASRPVVIASNQTAVPVTMTSTTVTGTVAVTESGTWTVQPGNTANTTAWKVDGSAVTQPVSVASIPSHAVTNAGTFAVQAAAVVTALQDGGAHVIVDSATAVADNTVVGTLTGSPVQGLAETTASALTSGRLGFVSIVPTTREVRVAATIASVPSHAVTNAGTFAVQAASTLAAETTKVIGTVNVAAAQTIGVTNTPLTNMGAGEYEAVAASATAQVIGATGAAGDYLSHVVVSPATAGCGVVTILDNATALVSFPGGGTTALSNLIPFVIPVGIISTSGAWKITTGANVSCVAVGNFT